MENWDGKERRNGINHLKELMCLKIESNEKALELQAKEYERRLENLNHEAERLRSMASTYLPRELYEAKNKEIEIKIESLQKIVSIGIGVLLTLQFILHFLN